MAGVRWAAWAWLLVLVVGGVGLRAAHALNWGSSVHKLDDTDRRWLEELCTESATKVNATLAALDHKLDTILAFVNQVMGIEESWMALARESAGTVERDLSGHLQAVALVEKAKNPTVTEEAAREEEDNSEEKENTEEDKEKEREQKRRFDSHDGDYEDDTKPKEPEKGECGVQVMDDHQTIGMFYMMSYNHGHCANRNPITVPIRHCLGYCVTRTYIQRDAGIWSQGNDCRSCQPNTFETIRIPLSCDDGFVFEKAFENVVDCKCRGCKPIEQ